MVAISERKISEIKAYVTEAGIECVPVYNFGNTGGATLDPNTDVDAIDNLVWGGNTVINAGPLSFTESTNGAGADAFSSNIVNEGDTGSITATCGSGAVNNRLTLYSGILLANGGAFFFGLGTYTYTFFVEVNSLSTLTTDEYYTAHGYQDGLIQATSNNGAFFNYDLRDGANWFFKTVKASTSTITDSGIPVVASTLYKFQIIVKDEAGTLTAYGYINDNLVATHTTNIPNTNSNTFGLVHKVVRLSATATTRTFTLRRYIRNQINFPSGR